MEKVRNIDVKGGVVNKPERGREYIYKILPATAVFRTTDCKETQKRVNRAKRHKLGSQVFRTILKREACEKHMIHEHMLKKDFPIGKQRMKTFLSRFVSLKSALSASEAGQSLFSIGADAYASFIHKANELFRCLQSFRKMLRRDLWQDGPVLFLRIKPVLHRGYLSSFHGGFQRKKTLSERGEPFGQGKASILHGFDERKADLPLLTIRFKTDDTIFDWRQLDIPLFFQETKRFPSEKKKLKYGLATVGAGDFVPVFFFPDAARIQTADVGQRLFAELCVNGAPSVSQT